MVLVATVMLWVKNAYLGKVSNSFKEGTMDAPVLTDQQELTYIYIYMCVCVCVCVWVWNPKQLQHT